MSKLSVTGRGQFAGATLGDEIYEHLRKEILLGRLRPNEFLVEAELAERLQVSRTPIRESLQRLAAEGLIVSTHRRWMVYEHTISEIREIYEVRLALEGSAARLACERATDDEIREILQLVNSWPHAMEPGNESRVDHNDRFHTLIVRSAHNKRLSALIEKNQQYYFNKQVALFYNKESIAESQRQHRGIAEAIEARDGDRAEEITRRHVQHALDLIIAHANESS
ncbi:DNA-binding GntR family transcriptional regulator [Spinactinospora alkalitolerans]|uniref:DNA-binding GntR family transcriptional regulator n=1 Tax=Spinactinospora alkalitolerans TaxID=687207 RepID=A0A852TND1_9ACTN|nr:GntR family transcriptional regulator [Spinactinospora alkalitolerans]NYE45448.1 DNA-binding GntR family transcriptional regulator [Spinactinospora alkalitolerans]